MQIEWQSPYRKDIIKFFLEMAEWLIPATMQAFTVVREGDMLSCVMRYEEVSEEAVALFKEEIALGIRFPYQARRLLALKGLSREEKERRVHEAIQARVHRFARYDYDMFSLMQKFLVSVSDAYKEARSDEMLARIIAYCYGAETLKQFPVFVTTPFGEERGMGIVVKGGGDEQQVIKAVQKHAPEAQIVETFITDGLLYVEVDVWFREAIVLEAERVVRPIFMPRNEEEVMKYMVTLAKQVTLIKDVPQVVILFQEQRDETLVFTLVMVRPRKGPSLAEVQAPFFIDIERIREAGYIRNRVVKEASLWRIELPQRTFLRRDGVVDLYKARQAIVLWLESWFGKIRDYNGGMIAKQQEVLDALSLLLPGEEDEVREFFYALSPAELRVVIPVEGLKEFYQMRVGVGAFGVYVDREIEGKEFLLLRLEGATACFFRSEGEKNRFLQLVEGGHSLV